MDDGDDKKINNLVVDPQMIESLPPNARRIFSVLEKEGDVIIKGGLAKLMVMRLLEQKDQFKDRARLDNESHINDIDLDFIVIGKVEAARDRVMEKFYRLYSEFERAGIYLDAKDVEIVEAESWTKGVEKIINRNDLAMNEVALDYFNGSWRLYYTQRACRNLIDGIGVLNPKPGHIFYSAGRPIPSALGMIRLIKFLAAGKVNKIYLPKWQRDLYFDNYQKKAKAGEAPPGAPLGVYSLVLMRNYFGDKPQLQKKAMVALYDLGFTDLLDPEMYIRQQEQIFKDAGNRFEQTEFSIEEVVERYLENKRKKEEIQRNRQSGKEICVHEFELIDCDLCGKNQCALESCVKCGRNKNMAPLPCAARMRRGQTDPGGFYEIK